MTDVVPATSVSNSILREEDSSLPVRNEETTTICSEMSLPKTSNFLNSALPSSQISSPPLNTSQQPNHSQSKSINSQAIPNQNYDPAFQNEAKQLSSLLQKPEDPTNPITGGEVVGKNSMNLSEKVETNTSSFSTEKKTEYQRLMVKTQQQQQPMPTANPSASPKSPTAHLKTPTTIRESSELPPATESANNSSSHKLNLASGDHISNFSSNLQNSQNINPIHQNSLISSNNSQTSHNISKNNMNNRNNNSLSSQKIQGSQTQDQQPSATQKAKDQPLHNLQISHNNKQSAVKLVGDLINKIGVLENKLNSCRKFIRDSPWRAESRQKHKHGSGGNSRQQQQNHNHSHQKSSRSNQNSREPGEQNTPTRSREHKFSKGCCSKIKIVCSKREGQRRT